MQKYQGGKASHQERWQLFEEFLQCHEDWSCSTFVASCRASREHQRQGQYKLLSREVTWMKKNMWWGGKHDMLISVHGPFNPNQGPHEKISWKLAAGRQHRGGEGHEPTLYIIIWFTIFKKYLYIYICTRGSKHLQPQEKDNQYEFNPDCPASSLHYHAGGVWKFP